MLNVGIVGSTGYVGSELMRILLNHSEVAKITATSQSYIGKRYSEVYENFRHIDIVCEEEDMDALAEQCDVIFTALPHGLASKKINESVLSKSKVIDMGADFRIKPVETYEKWYGQFYAAHELLDEAVYGLSEINRDKIKTARLVANPGCYTTCSILSLYPLLKEGLIDPDSIIIDAKSGVSGAGRGLDLGTHFCETDESVKAYKIASHRHTPEIEEQLSYAAGRDIALSFTPHLIPMNRGILATCYATFNFTYSYEDARSAFDKYYSHEFFVRITKDGVFPETKWVKTSNFCDIGFTVDARTKRIIVVGALDNLVKGAAGQAVQNMNIMFGFDERTALNNIGCFPV